MIAIPSASTHPATCSSANIKRLALPTESITQTFLRVCGPEPALKRYGAPHLATSARAPYIVAQDECVTGCE